MCQCTVVNEDVNFNRCSRNPEGWIILPNGQFLPRTIPGATMRDRIEEWHRRNGSPPRGDTNANATTSMCYGCNDLAGGKGLDSRQEVKGDKEQG